MRLVPLDKFGWPVERIRGRPIINAIRVLILTRGVITEKEWKRRELRRQARAQFPGAGQAKRRRTMTDVEREALDAAREDLCENLLSVTVAKIEALIDAKVRAILAETGPTTAAAACSTCLGAGELDQRLGGEATSGVVPCPDLAQPARDEMPAPATVDCERCRREQGLPRDLMIVCPKCGNKRCPKAADHRFACSASNEPNQVGIPDPAHSPATRADAPATASVEVGEDVPPASYEPCPECGNSWFLRRHADREQRVLNQALRASEQSRSDADAKYREEYAIVDRVWQALGVTSYEDAEGKAIDELVRDLSARAETAEAALASLRERDTAVIGHLNNGLRLAEGAWIDSTPIRDALALLAPSGNGDGGTRANDAQVRSDPVVAELVRALEPFAAVCPPDDMLDKEGDDPTPLSDTASSHALFVNELAAARAALLKARAAGYGEAGS